MESQVNAGVKQQSNRAGRPRGVKRKHQDDEFHQIVTNAPTDMNIGQFADARSREIESMTKILLSTGKKIRVIQKLPNHMRRRAMSHNIKRVPRRLRERAKQDMGPGVKVTKRPSRRHRRRPSNLLAEYNRRQRKHNWIETHLWHAKRFHMTEQWGYTIPLHPNDKGKRAAYRASVKHAMLQDVSYYTFIEIVGCQDKILSQLQQLVHQNTGLTFAARGSVSGDRHGSCVVYRPGAYPYGAIGPVQFLWKPVSAADREGLVRQLWLWCHPAMYQQLFDTILMLYNMTQDDKDNKNTSGENTLDANQMSSPGIVKIHSNPSYSIEGVTVKSLKDHLVQFRLTGLLSHAVIVDMLEPVVVAASGDHTALVTTDDQMAAWQRVKSVHTSSELPSNCALGLVVRDPRLNRPLKKSKMTIKEDEGSEAVHSLPVNGSTSLLWDEEVRQAVAANKMSDADMNKRRSEMLVPGSDLKLGADECCIPVLLLHNPGHQQIPGSSGPHQQMQSCGSGWNIILPAGWAMPFWLGLIYRGARAVGLREWESTSVEQNVLHFPIDYPDTLSGLQLLTETREKAEAKYKRFPPDKRSNYFKLGIKSPFVPPWQQLAKESHDDIKDNTNTDLVVVRDRKLLKQLALAHRKSEKDNLNSVEKDIIPQALVPLNVHMVLRGTPDTNSVICLPLEEDLKLLQENPKYGGPMEPAHKVPKEIELAKKVTKTSQVLPTVENVVSSCSRQCIGFINRGGYSLSNGQGAGFGFCTLRGLKQLYDIRRDGQSSKNVVLIRPPRSLQYRFAYITVKL